MVSTSKPFSPSCERNQDVILNEIKAWLRNAKTVLEIGSGTGQHAVYFSKAMPHLSWQTSDLLISHPGINSWIEDSGLNNVLAPLEIDALAHHWPELKNKRFDTIFTANSLHIMSSEAVTQLFDKLKVVMNTPCQLIIYGPFKVNGEFTSESNSQFEQRLKALDTLSGIRDLEWIQELASKQGLTLSENVDMPANNKLLKFTGK